jgi:hypothetical protein
MRLASMNAFEFDEAMYFWHKQKDFVSYTLLPNRLRYPAYCADYVSLKWLGRSISGFWAGRRPTLLGRFSRPRSGYVTGS